MPKDFILIIIFIIKGNFHPLIYSVTHLASLKKKMVEKETFAMEPVLEKCRSAAQLVSEQSYMMFKKGVRPF